MFTGNQMKILIAILISLTFMSFIAWLIYKAYRLRNTDGFTVPEDSIDRLVEKLQKEVK